MRRLVSFPQEEDNQKTFSEWMTEHKEEESEGAWEEPFTPRQTPLNRIDQYLERHGMNKDNKDEKPEISLEKDEELNRMPLVALGALHLCGELLPLVKIHQWAASFPLVSFLDGVGEAPNHQEPLDEWLQAGPYDALASPWLHHLLMWETNIEVVNWGWLTMVSGSVNVSKQHPMVLRQYLNRETMLPDLRQTDEPIYSACYAHEVPPSPSPRASPKNSPRAEKPPSMRRPFGLGGGLGTTALGPGLPSFGGGTTFGGKLRPASASVLPGSTPIQEEDKGLRERDFEFVAGDWAVSCLRQLYQAVPRNMNPRSRHHKRSWKGALALVQTPFSNPLVPNYSRFFNAHAPTVLTVTLKPSALLRFLLQDHLLRSQLQSSSEGSLLMDLFLGEDGQGFLIEATLCLPFGYPLVPLCINGIDVFGIDDRPEVKEELKAAVTGWLEEFFSNDSWRNGKGKGAPKNFEKFSFKDRFVADPADTIAPFVGWLVRNVQGANSAEAAFIGALKTDFTKHLQSDKISIPAPMKVSDLTPVDGTGPGSPAWLGYIFTLYPALKLAKEGGKGDWRAIERGWGVRDFGGVMLSPRIIADMNHHMPALSLLPSSTGIARGWWSEMAAISCSIGARLSDSLLVLGPQGPRSTKLQKGRRLGPSVVAKPLHRILGVLIARQSALMTRRPPGPNPSAEIVLRQMSPEKFARRVQDTFCGFCGGCAGKGLLGTPLCKPLQTMLSFVASQQVQTILADNHTPPHVAKLMISPFKTIRKKYFHKEVTQHLKYDATTMQKIALTGAKAADDFKLEDEACGFMDKSSGTRVDGFIEQYKPIKLLGSGGFGTVLLCKKMFVADPVTNSRPHSRSHSRGSNRMEEKEKDTGTLVAVKIIPLLANAEKNKMLQREVELLAKTSLQYVTQYFAAWVETLTLDSLFSRIADSVGEELVNQRDPTMEDMLKQYYNDDDGEIEPGPVWLANYYPQLVYEPPDHHELRPPPSTLDKLKRTQTMMRSLSMAAARGGEQSAFFGTVMRDNIGQSMLWSKNEDANEDGTVGLNAKKMLFIAMEYVDGLNLNGFLDHLEYSLPPVPSLPSIWKCELASELVKSICAMQATKLLHRDLKPDNVLIRRIAGTRKEEAAEILSLTQESTGYETRGNRLTRASPAQGMSHRESLRRPAPLSFGETGELVLVDLGLSRITDEETGPAAAPGQMRPKSRGISKGQSLSIRKSHAAHSEARGGAQALMSKGMGTFRYAAPEQWGMSSMFKEYDYRVDCYSLGVILFELFGARPSTMMENVVMNQIFASNTGRLDLPEAIEALVPKDIQELAGALTVNDFRRRPFAAELWAALPTRYTLGEKFEMDESGRLDRMRVIHRPFEEAFPTVTNILMETGTSNSPYKQLMLEAIDELNIHRCKPQPIIDSSTDAFAMDIESVVKHYAIASCYTPYQVTEHFLLKTFPLEGCDQWVSLSEMGIPVHLRSSLVEELALVSEQSIPGKVCERRFCIDHVYPEREKRPGLAPPQRRAAMCVSIDAHRLNAICLGDDPWVHDSEWHIARVDTAANFLLNQLRQSVVQSVPLDRDESEMFESTLKSIASEMKKKVKAAVMRDPAKGPSWQRAIKNQKMTDMESLEAWEDIKQLIWPSELRGLSQQALLNTYVMYSSMYLGGQIRDAIGIYKQTMFLHTEVDEDPLKDAVLLLDGSQLLLILAWDIGGLAPQEMVQLQSVLRDSADGFRTDCNTPSCPSRCAARKGSTDEGYQNLMRSSREAQEPRLAKLVPTETIFKTISTLKQHRPNYSWRRLLALICRELFPLVKNNITMATQIVTVEGTEIEFHGDHPYADLEYLSIAGYLCAGANLCPRCFRLSTKTKEELKEAMERGNGNGCRDGCIPSNFTVAPSTMLRDLRKQSQKYEKEVLRTATWAMESHFIQWIYQTLCVKLFDDPNPVFPDLNAILDPLFNLSWGADPNEPDSDVIWRPLYGRPPEEMMVVLFGLCALWPKFMEQLLMVLVSGRAGEFAIGCPLPSTGLNWRTRGAASADEAINPIADAMRKNPTLVLDLPLSDSYVASLLPPFALPALTLKEFKEELENQRGFDHRGFARGGKMYDKDRGMMEGYDNKDKTWIKKHEVVEVELSLREKLLYLMIFEESLEQEASAIDELNRQAHRDGHSPSPIRIVLNRSKKMTASKLSCWSPFGVEWSLWHAPGSSGETLMTRRDEWRGQYHSKKGQAKKGQLRPGVMDFHASELSLDESVSKEEPIMIAIGGGNQRTWDQYLGAHIPEDRALSSLLDLRAGAPEPPPLRARNPHMAILNISFEISIPNMMRAVQGVTSRHNIRCALTDHVYSRGKTRLEPPVKGTAFGREYDHKDGFQMLIHLFQGVPTSHSLWRLRRVTRPQVLIIAPRDKKINKKDAYVYCPQLNTELSQFYWRPGSFLKNYIDRKLEVECLVLPDDHPAIKTTREFIQKLNGFIITVRYADESYENSSAFIYRVQSNLQKEKEFTPQGVLSVLTSMVYKNREMGT